jgi:hypothetical protein
MTAILALEQLEAFNFEGLEEEIHSVLSGSDTEGPFTARVMLSNPRNLSLEQLVLRFSNAELFRRFGKLTLEAQEQVGLCLLNWTEQERNQTLRSGHVNPDLKLEVEFQWSATKRRRLAISYDISVLRARYLAPYRNVFLALNLL